MKRLQQFCAAVFLTSVLALSALAGDIQAPGVTSPPPPPQSSVAGDISMPGATSTGEIPGPGVFTLDPVTEAALGVFQIMLSLF